MRTAAASVIVASMSARRNRVGVVAVLVAGVAALAGYLNNWFAGLGLPFGGPPGASAPKSVDEPAEASGKARIVVQGEQCMLAGEAAPRSCDAVCKEVSAGAADVDATVGSQRTVDALRACLQGRGVKIQVLSE